MFSKHTLVARIKEPDFAGSLYNVGQRKVAIAYHFPSSYIVCVSALAYHPEYRSLDSLDFCFA